MLKAGGVKFNEETDQFGFDLKVVIACGLQNDDRRAILALAVLPRTGKAVDVEDAPVPTRHNRQPRLKVAPQNIVFLGCVRFQFPDGADWFTQVVIPRTKGRVAHCSENIALPPATMYSEVDSS